MDASRALKFGKKQFTNIKLDFSRTYLPIYSGNLQLQFKALVLCAVKLRVRNRPPLSLGYPVN